jgi:hypothetical protein
VKRGCRALSAALALALCPALAQAHGFGQLYNLPVPLALYAWGSAAVLVLSFAIAGYFATRSAAALPPPQPLGSRWQAAWKLGAPALQVLSLLLWGLALATAALGHRDPFRNFSMTFFWVWFLLGFSYLTALLGNGWALLNPWRLLAKGLGRVWRGYTQGRLRYPERLGDWPALTLYLGFIWIELFGHNRPPQLALMLSAYTLLNLLGVGLIGARAWFTHVEFFSVFLRLTGLMGVFCRGADGRLRLRRPFAGLLQQRPTRLTTVVFLLAMLSTTAFDGLKATQWWVYLFWLDATGLITPLAGDLPIRRYAQLRGIYIVWESVWLFASPFLYIGLYWLAVAGARALTGSTRPVRELALDFAHTLLPIVLVYHFTHYFTLLLDQGPKILSLLSDPFGWGWNLFGTAGRFRAPILPEMSTIWHSQVALIVLGHVVSVVLAHRVALQVFPDRRRAVLSQLPMLLLMVAFTVAGLWIMAQPLTDLKMM